MKISYLGNLTSTCLLLASFFCVQSAPARPLNERSTEFAWVILDEQQSDSSPRRKITPKSIFISPSFGALNCSAGYTLDANGRCVKVVKLDTSAHEQFVLELLNQNFGNYEDYDDEEELVEVGGGEALPTPGPFQFNIPLDMMDADRDKISIIVAPTNGHFDDTMKIEDKKQTSHLDAPLIITNINVNAGGENQTQTRTTTTTTTTTMRPVQSDIGTSTLPTTITTRVDDLTTFATEAPEIETTTFDLQAQEQQAIFFKIPTDQQAEDDDGAGIGTTTLGGPEEPPPPPPQLQPQPPAATHNAVRFPDRPTFDEALFHDFLQDMMKKQVNRRFVTKTQTAQTTHDDALYNNHRNRDRWLFPRFLDDDDGDGVAANVHHQHRRRSQR